MVSAFQPTRLNSLVWKFGLVDSPPNFETFLCLSCPPNTPQVLVDYALTSLGFTNLCWCAIFRSRCDSSWLRPPLPTKPFFDWWSSFFFCGKTHKGASPLLILIFKLISLFLSHLEGFSLGWTFLFFSYVETIKSTWIAGNGRTKVCSFFFFWFSLEWCDHIQYL